MRSRVHFLAIIFLPLLAHADAASWRPLTSDKNPICNDESPCRVLESNASFELTFEWREKWATKQFQKIYLKSLKDGSIQSFNINDVSSVDQAKYFRIYLVPLNGDGNVDIALYTYNSATEGEMYHYLIYVPKEGRFVYNEITMPRLTREGASFVTPITKTRYVLDPKAKFVPTEKPK